ncbi:GNAT family N-acetyltransferase [Salininema proteolyticum]|uniref:GNAT family N-acetyltransferase n=1 Tax=Salininema proteolyticum TaxID=1607685 RepID=A0ABV8U088_9ACTN
MLIRPSTAADARDIFRVRKKSWKAAYAGVISAEFMDRIQEEPTPLQIRGFDNLMDDRYTYVAVDGERVAAFLTVGHYRDQDTPDHTRRPEEGGEIWALYADPAYYRSGVGTMLMKAGLARLDEQGLSPVRLWVLRENERAKAFYRSQGFEWDGASSDLDLNGEIHVEDRFALIRPR